MKTANERAKELNDETRAWLAEDPANRGAFLLVEDPAWWAESNVHTADELDRYLAISDYSDAYKEKWGVRPRRDISHMTTAEIVAATEALFDTQE